MNKKTTTKLLLIASICLLLAGEIFMVVAIIGYKEGQNTLSISLGCLLLANIFNVIRLQMQTKLAQQVQL